MRVRAAPAETLRIVPLDALTAIYDRRSGQTHLVAAEVATMLPGLDGECDADLTELIEAGLVEAR